ncbi:aminotransferase class V-fold PLP-dependent enzyme [Candidatus Laterigemmans baculatus]|uniref:aminotransferase class V-fold PLP-dependent enzyme n=1 Tax=Candidatus Laterigemmans baculatus TaxID=2770505 RepID=UPI0013DA4CB8|nr:aminotransferase class V-fold PLP-dependent enzyme [Candidatus Laterigemmans baculatus]
MVTQDAADGQSLAQDPWQWWRRQMPIIQRWAYFDHAAVAPLPAPAAAALVDFAQAASEQGDTVWPEWSANLGRLRSGIATWLHASPDEIALVPNTTFGINIVAEGLRWREGDNVVIPGGEFPSNHFPWQNQERRGVELRVVPSPGGRVDLDGIRRAIDGRTRIVAASWVGYASGYRLPLEQLCELTHEAGALFFLDAIQGLGVFPLDLSATPVDFLAADGHKWMLGPEGAGVAFIRHAHLDQLDCTAVGWHSVVGGHAFDASQFQLRDAASRYEGGSMNMAGLIAMHESLKLFWEVGSQHGAEAIGERILTLHAHAREALQRNGASLISDWPEANRSGIVTFQTRGPDPADVRNRLAEAGIAVSCRGGGIRASIHAYNTTEEIDRMAEAIR